MWNDPVLGSGGDWGVQTAAASKISSWDLVIQWLRVYLPRQEAKVWSLTQEDPTCHGAMKPMNLNYWAGRPRASALQQEKTQQWEAHALDSRLCSLQLEKACTQQRRPRTAKSKINKYLKISTISSQLSAFPGYWSAVCSRKTCRVWSAPHSVSSPKSTPLRLNWCESIWLQPHVLTSPSWWPHPCCCWDLGLSPAFLLVPVASIKCYLHSKTLSATWSIACLPIK